MMDILELAELARPKPAKPHIVIRQDKGAGIWISGVYAVIFASRAEQAKGPGFFSWVSHTHRDTGDLLRYLRRCSPLQ